MCVCVRGDGDGGVKRGEGGVKRGSWNLIECSLGFRECGFKFCGKMREDSSLGGFGNYIPGNRV